MAVTVTVQEKFVVGDRTMVVADVVFDGSYAIGGEPVTADNFELRNSITHVFATVARDPDAVDNAVVLDWDSTNKKLVAFWGDYSNASDGVLVEVADTTALSAYTARVVAVGK